MNKIYAKGIVEKGLDGEITVTVSDESVDRAGDSIPVASWDLKNFLNAPRMFVDHDYRVEKLTGIWKNVKAENGKLKMTPVFHDITEVARVNKEMVAQGYLNTTSVGYIPHKSKDGVVTNELLEVSWVGVPCNPNARVEGQAVKSIGDSANQLDASQETAIKAFCDEFGLKEAEAKAPAAGEACTMDDGTDGVLTDDGKGGLSCQLKKEEKSANKKGIIDDTNQQLSELREDKWPMMCAVWDAVQDFYCAFMSDASAVTQFAPMVSDLCATLIALQDGTVPIEEVADDDEMMLAFQGTLQKMVSFRGLETKSGRTLSTANRDIIKAAIDSIESGTSALKDLHAATDTTEAGDDAGKGTEEKKVESSKSSAFGSKEEMKQFIFQRQVMQEVNTLTANVLAEMRKKLSN